MPSLVPPKFVLTRSDLGKLFPNNSKALLAFEQLFRSNSSNTEAITTGTAATQALNDATVITLSPNATLNNERVLAIDPAAFSLTDNGPGNTIVLALVNLITKTAAFRCQFDLNADTRIALPANGRVPSSTDGPYASDAAAAAAGVQIGEIYKGPTGTVVWRQT